MCEASEYHIDLLTMLFRNFGVGGDPKVNIYNQLNLS